VRATLLKATAYQHAGDFHAAINAYESLSGQSQRMIPGIGQELRTCYARLTENEAAATDRDGGKTGVDQHSGAEPVIRFRCEECGFSSRKLFWQCPGCRSWSSVKPLAQGRTE
jgi:lipopolysaccharide biosynthesis regulator YciM